MKALLRCLVLLVVGAAPGMASAADDPAHYRLSAAALDKMEAVDAEARRLGLTDKDEEEDEDNPDDEESEQDTQDEGDVDALVRRIESHPEYRALLARHGLSARELVLTTHALLHAGTYLAFEKAMDKDATARLLGGYTPAQRDNIEFMRQRVGTR